MLQRRIARVPCRLPAHQAHHDARQHYKHPVKYLTAIQRRRCTHIGFVCTGRL